jgi:hypothetical protein
VKAVLYYNQINSSRFIPTLPTTSKELLRLKMSTEYRPQEQNDDIKISDDQQRTITLQVGEQHFTTFPSTLTTESHFFASLLSPQWQHVQADGSYFVDADGALFPYILRYLRSGGLPLFYSTSAGHDHGMYQALLGEAQHIQIERLMDWLRNKKYERAVKIEYSVQEFEGSQQLAKSCFSDLQVEYKSTWATDICPRGINSHRGDPSACGKLCMRAQGDAEREFEDGKVLKTVVISKRTVLNCGLCLPE